MAKTKTKPLGLDGSSTPAQEDEADIVEEVGAERDEESGDLIASEEAVVKIGAVDAESVRENRRMSTAVGKKRANVPNVHFNTTNVLEKYEFIVRSWPPNTIDISMKRLTGTPVQHMITSRPRSGAELYDAFMLLHGQSEEAKYEIRFTDSNEKCFRGTGNITLPDTRPAQGANMPHPPPYGYPPGYPPPGYPPGAYPPPPGYPQQPPQAQSPQGAAQPQQAPQPIYVQPSAAPDMGSMLQSFRQLLETFQSMQQTMQPQQAAAMPQMPMPPMPAPGAPMDMAAMTAWVQTIADMVQRMQPQAAPVRVAPQPQVAGVPPFPTPPGMIHVPGIGFVPYDALQQAMHGGSVGRPPPYRSAHRPPPYEEPPYARGPEYDPQQRPPGGPYQQRMYGGPPPPPPPPKSIAQQIRESVGFVQEAITAAREIENILPRQPQQEAFEPPEQDEDGPKVEQIGSVRVVRNDDGTMRPWESILANSDKIIKGATDAFREIQEASRQHAQQQRPQQHARLPEGTVVVTEGFVPPPGYVAVPIDQIPPERRGYPQQPQHHTPPPPAQRGFAPPPQHIPPSIHAQPVAQAPRAWETVAEGEG